jgi:hypothetical protein
MGCPVGGGALALLGVLGTPEEVIWCQS